MTDEEITDADAAARGTEGIFADHRGRRHDCDASRLAADGTIRPDERVVAYVTGHGLKTLDRGRRPRTGRRRYPPHARRVPRDTVPPEQFDH